MATFSRVSPSGWQQGDDASTLSRVSPTGWESVTASAATVYTIDAASGSYTLTGAAAELLAQRNVDAQSGSYALTGADATLASQRFVDAETGSYALTGSDGTLVAARVLNAEAGAYTLTGADAEFSAPGQTFAIEANAGSYAITGADASLTAQRFVNAEAGAYSLTGSDATLISQRALNAEAGSYTLTGADASLGIAGLYELDAEAGSYVLTGADAGFEAPQVLVERTKRGGGAPGRPGRKIVVQIDDERFLVDTPEEARQLIAQAERLAETSAQAKAAELATRERVRLRAARRAAPVVRVETPEPVPQIEAIREQVANVNERIQSMYMDALRTALIAREIRRRMDEDEEDAIAALML